MRRRLNPLSAHLGMAVLTWLRNQSGSDFSSQAPPEILSKMLRGIQKYESCDYKLPDMELHTFWTAGSVSISRVPACNYATGKPAVLLVPSLVNTCRILDLMPGRSLLRWLAEQGLAPYLLDWGQISGDTGAQTIEDLLLNRLVAGLRFLEHETGSSLHVLGHCMSGTLLAAAAAHTPEVMQSLVFLAAPWDFHAGSQRLLNRIRLWGPSALAFMSSGDTLPSTWLQSFFATLDPEAAMKKFAAFSDMDPKSEREKLFVAVEDWLNDNVDLPCAIAQHCLENWFYRNAPAQGAWAVGGRTIAAGRIDVPALIIASKHDRLVEYESARALAVQMPQARLHTPDCGHIGMIAGAHAVETVWWPIAEWVREQA